MKLWLVFERRPLDGRGRKVYVFRYVAAAETGDAAIAIVQEGNRHVYGSTHTVEEVDGGWLGVGCHTATPTAAERTARDEARAEMAERSRRR